MNEEPKFKQMSPSMLHAELERLHKEAKQAEAKEKDTVSVQAHAVLALGGRRLEDMTPMQQRFASHLTDRFFGQRYVGRMKGKSPRHFSIPTRDRGK